MKKSKESQSKKKSSKSVKQSTKALAPKKNSRNPNKKKKKDAIVTDPNPNPNLNPVPNPPTKVAATQLITPVEHRNFFVEQFESTNGTKLSSLELDSIKDTYFIKLLEGINQEPDNLGKHMKNVFASSWKQVLCENQLVEGKIDPGNPAVLVISASAIRALEMLRGLRMFTKECQAVKLFAKHLKVDEQVEQLKNRVNIASGTPNRIKKLCEIEALGLSRLELIVLDMHTDVKGYSLLTLPQVKDEFWDLYKTYIHQLLLQGSLRVCLYGPIRIDSGRRVKNSSAQ